MDQIKEQIKEQIIQLKADKEAYLEREKSLIARHGMVKTLVRLKDELSGIEEQHAAQKEATKELRRKRENALRTVCLAIANQVDKWLVKGQASIEITEEGKVHIGWIIDSQFHPMPSISGGEQVQFMTAFSQVLSPADGNTRLHFVELAESGTQAGDILKQIIQASGPNEQIIACNCYPMEVPKGWDVKRHDN